MQIYTAPHAATPTMQMVQVRHRAPVRIHDRSMVHHHATMLIYNLITTMLIHRRSTIRARHRPKTQVLSTVQVRNRSAMQARHCSTLQSHHLSIFKPQSRNRTSSRQQHLPEVLLSLPCFELVQRGPLLCKLGMLCCPHRRRECSK
jgi:hypothetical protein